MKLKIVLSANFKIKHGVGKFRMCMKFGDCATIEADLRMDWSDNDVEYFINKHHPLEY